MEDRRDMSMNGGETEASAQSSEASVRQAPQSLVVDRDAPPTLHSQLADVMREKILSHEWAAGKRIASEHELMATYGLSRGTVRHAIKSLVSEGLLVQYHGRGTFVPSNMGEQRGDVCTIEFVNLPKSLQEQYDTRFLEQKTVSAPVDVAGYLGVEPGTRLLYLYRAFLDEGVPFACAQSWFRIDLCPGIDTTKLGEGPSLRAEVEGLAGRPVASTKMRFSACSADPRIHTVIPCKEGDSFLVLECLNSFENNEVFGYGKLFMQSGHAIVGKMK